MFFHLFDIKYLFCAILQSGSIEIVAKGARKWHIVLYTINRFKSAIQRKSNRKYVFLDYNPKITRFTKGSSHD
jgi:hypothetical protein